jgi:hypothetical protein
MLSKSVCVKRDVSGSLLHELWRTLAIIRPEFKKCKLKTVEVQLGLLSDI